MQTLNFFSTKHTLESVSIKFRLGRLHAPTHTMKPSVAVSTLHPLECSWVPAQLQGALCRL